MKFRPVIIVGTHRVSLQAIQLTTKTEYKSSGRPRIAIPNWRGLGLDKPAWLWSPNLALVYRLGIKKHVGWVHHEVVDVLEKNTKLTSEEISRLREVADKYHRRSY